MSSTYPTSLPLCDNVPQNTTTAVRNRGGVVSTITRSTAPISPLCSATASPIRHTRTRPSGAKLMKLGRAPVIIRCRPSTVSRLTTVTTLPVPGCTTCTPAALSQADRRTTRPARRMNRVTGLGSALPAFSTTLSNRCEKEGDSPDVDGMLGLKEFSRGRQSQWRPMEKGGGSSRQRWPGLRTRRWPAR